jgi:ATP/maltotriose-dependent transcriptional regulator MalT
MAESIDLAERTGFVEDLAIAYTNYADSLHVAGQTRRARDLVEEGLARIRDRIVSQGGSVRPFRFIRLNLAEMNFELGEWDLAEEALEEAGTAVQGTALAHARLRWAQVALGRGRPDEEISAALDEARELLRDALEPQYIALLAILCAELELRRGDHEAARGAVDDGLDRIQFCSEDGIRIALIAATGLTVEAEIAERARDIGDRERERVAIGRAERFFGLVEAADEEAAGRVEAAVFAGARAEVARAKGEDDADLWRAAASEWAQLERPYSEALALWRGGQAALARGDRGAAKSLLAQACAIARRLGAGWLEGEVEGLATRARLAPLDAAEPDAAGATPIEEATPFGLTARELQVLELLSVGATNREIGERLFMAEKTASVHVSRILAKLDVRSRTEAAAVAHRHGIGGAVESGA